MRYFLIALLIFSSLSAFSQKDVDFDSGPRFADRVYTGGGFGFSTSSFHTYLALAPIVGYMVSPRLSVGVGVEYQYYVYKQVPTATGVENFDDHRYGAKFFATFKVFGPAFLYADYNFLNLNPAPWLEGTQRQTYDRLLLGGGLSQPAGRASINLFAAYDVLYDDLGPWGSPWVIGVFVSI